MKRILLITFATIFVLSTITIAYAKKDLRMRISYRSFCTELKDRPSYSNAFLKCVLNGNPKSDEEPEDWIPVCAKVAKEVWCPLTKGVRYWDSNGSTTNWIPWDEVPALHQEILMKELKYN